MLKNRDLNNSNDELKEIFIKACNCESEEDFAKYQVQAAKKIQDEIIEQARNFAVEEFSDRSAYQMRGIDVLTSEELKFYNEVKSNGGFKGIDDTFPITVIDRVFKNLTQEHPLLEKIQLVNTTGITRWIARKSDAEGAQWGKLGTEIKKKLDSEFEVIDTTLNKLSAFVPVSNDILELAPEWLDKYVRTILGESIAIGLEKAIIEGTGVDMPIGMLKDPTKAKDPTNGYPDKDTTTLADFKPKTLGEKIMKPLVDGKVKTINNVTIICNPGDYWSKIFPSTTILSADGHYVFNVLPISAEVVQSAFVPEGKMIACVTEDYFMGIGFNGGIKYSDEYQFLEDERVYLQKLLGHGQPIDNESFLVFDISAMQIPSV